MIYVPTKPNEIEEGPSLMARPTARKISTAKGDRWKGVYYCIDELCPSRLKVGHCKGHTKDMPLRERKSEALRDARERQTEIEKSGSVTRDKDKITLDGLAEDFFGSAPDIKDSTLDWYRSVYYPKISPTLGHIPVLKIKVPVIRNWMYMIRDEGLAQGTIADYRKVLTRLLSFAEEIEVIDAVPGRRLKSPKSLQPEKAPIVEFTQEEFWQIAHHIRDDYKLMILFAAFCGLRIGELAGLRRDDLEWDEGNGWIIHVRKQVQDGKLTSPKTPESIRDIPVPREVWEFIRAHLYCYEIHRRLYPSANPHKVLFPSPKADLWMMKKPEAKREGALLSTDTFRKREWYPALERAGLDKRRFHILRSSFTVDSLINGMPPHIVSKLLGHADLTITMNKYGKRFALSDLVRETQKKSGIHDEESLKQKALEVGAAGFAADFAAESGPPVLPPVWDASGNSMN